MKTMYVDFSGNAKVPGLAPRSPREFVLWAILTAAVIVCGIGLVVMSQTQSRTAAVKAQTAEVVAGQMGSLEPDREVNLSTEAIADINDAIAYLNFPWIETFNAFEKATYPSVTLMSVEAGMGRLSSKLIVDAPGADEILAYIENLRKQPYIGEVSLLRQELFSLDNNTQVMRFTLDVKQATKVSSDD